MTDSDVAIAAPASGLTQLFAIHENGEGVLPLILPDQEVSTMLQTVLGNADTSLDSSILSGFMRAITI
ncbi:hypothetical protein PVAP13_8KG144300 [Panicum virgatum]|uniref:Uncharacterized protein n=1 Tax=Panicum virgatum TaxID=38727 RepID=A0A8T0PP98_PANVG|nr:hypothetical protein PVAP13_8KG144300 [Panicum virgatum]